MPVLYWLSNNKWKLLPIDGSGIDDALNVILKQSDVFKLQGENIQQKGKNKQLLSYIFNQSPLLYKLYLNIRPTAFKTSALGGWDHLWAATSNMDNYILGRFG